MTHNNLGLGFYFKVMGVIDSPCLKILTVKLIFGGLPSQPWKDYPHSYQNAHHYQNQNDFTIPFLKLELGYSIFGRGYAYFEKFHVSGFCIY